MTSNTHSVREVVGNVKDILDTYPGAPCSCPKHKFLLDAKDDLDGLVEQLETLRVYVRALEVDLNAAGDELHGLREQLETAQIRDEALCTAVEIIQDERDGLKEQLDAMQQAARKFLATGNEIDLADLTTPGEYLVDLIPHQWPGYASTPAKRPT